jgi:DNA-binding HxlR family transcriptional regulator
VLLASGGKGEDILRAYFADLVGTATKRRILDDNPTLSRRTVERVLQKLQSEGIIEKVGAARATTYRRVER